MNTFGERLRDLRKNKNLTQEDLAKLFYLNKSSISRYEKNMQLPENELLKKIADYFKVSVDYLICMSDIKESADTVLNNIDVPQSYSDKYKVTSKDRKQYEAEMKKANEAFFMDDALDESAKKEMLDLMNELFWKAKSMNKRK